MAHVWDVTNGGETTSNMGNPVNTGEVPLVADVKPASNLGNPVDTEEVPLVPDIKPEVKTELVANPEPIEKVANSHRSSSARPSDVARMFPRNLKYSGAPTEPLQRRFNQFLNTAKLANVDVTNLEMMFPLIETVFLKDQALLHFQDVIRHTATTVEEVIDLLTAQFLGHRAKRESLVYLISGLDQEAIR